HTGLMRHREAGDMMRYAALNQGLDMLSAYAGFRPGTFEDLASGRSPIAVMPGKELGNDGLPVPETQERYSDAQLFALTKFLYSLTPPPNPNPSSTLSKRGEIIFTREGCNHCHPSPLYTS